MESLASLSRFTEKYPQMVNEELQYSFTGGSGIRLNQELAKSQERRPITDFDLIIFREDESVKYPTHQFNLKRVRDLIDLTDSEVLDLVKFVEIDGKKYYFMDSNFLTLSKTCAFDNPRPKDLDDIYRLDELDLIDFGKLKELYSKAVTITHNSDLVIETLKWVINYPKDETIAREKLFASFPKLVNLLNEFEKYDLAKNMVVSFCEEYSGDGNATASVIYNVHSVIREVRFDEEDEKLETLDWLLTKAGLEDYRDFDHEVHLTIIPKLRYSKPKLFFIIDRINNEENLSVN